MFNIVYVTCGSRGLNAQFSLSNMHKEDIKQHYSKSWLIQNPRNPMNYFVITKVIPGSGSTATEWAIIGENPK